MSLVSTKQLFFVPEFISQSYAAASITLNATGERCGQIKQIWTAGNIRKVHFRTALVTTGDTMKVTIQTVGTSDGLPSGSLIDAEATGTVVVADGDDNAWKTVDFGESATVAVTQGQFVAICIEFNSYGSGNLAISGAMYTPYSMQTSYNSYVVKDITASPGTWIKDATAWSLSVMLEYSDGTFAPDLDYGGAYGSSTGVSSSTNPDEVGNYFQSTYPFRAVGFWIFGEFDYNVTLSLLGADDTILANATFEADYRIAGAEGLQYVAFDSDPASTVTIAKDTWYRVIVTPGADAIYVNLFTVPTAASMDKFPFGQNCYWTQATDRDAVTDWAQTTTKRCMIGLVGDQLDDGSGGGGSSPRFGDMTGGLR